MRKGDNKYRFSLQWGANTEEGILVGEFLEQLGNKKSGFIVMAVREYLHQHPEAMTPGAQIKITAKMALSREQLLSEVKSVVKAYVEEALATTIPDRRQEIPTGGSPVDTSDQGLNDMLENLSFFNQ